MTTTACPRAATLGDPAHVSFITGDTFPFHFDVTNCGTVHFETQEWRGIQPSTPMMMIVLSTAEPSAVA